MNYNDRFEKENKKIIELWFNGICSFCEIANEEECRKFLSKYFSIILNNLIEFNPKSVTYLNRNLRNGFFSDFSLDQIFNIHLKLKKILIQEIKQQPAETQIQRNAWLLVLLQEIDKYFLRILELFSPQFDLLVKYYKSRYTHLTENISEIVYSLSPRGTFNYISPSIKNILGICHDEIKDINQFIEYILPEDRKLFRDNFKKQIKHKTESKLNLRIINQPQDKRHYFFNHSVPNLDTFGNLIGVEGILFDITERELQQKALE